MEAAANRLRFVAMTPADLPDVGILERRNYTFPWRESIFTDCIKSGYTCLLVHQGSALIGYAVLQIAADESHILNLCIDNESQGQGFARQLLARLMQIATEHRAGMMFLEVRPSNKRAVELYRRAGFNEIGLRRNYYDAENGREDALVMACALFSSS